MKDVIVKNSLKSPDKNGKYWRVICLNGPNKGVVYYLNSKRIVFGRGEVHIKVEDKASSREHAELSKLNEDYVLTDLGSQNGIRLNSKKVRQMKLKDGDKFNIGTTIFKYEILQVNNPLALLKEVVGATSEDEIAEWGDVETKEEPASGKKKKLLIGLFGILALLYLFDDSTPTKTGTKTSTTVESGLDGNFKNITINEKKDTEMDDKIAGIIHRGLREYREKNYFRAINEFNLALMLQPNHARASFYLRKTKQSLDDEIKINFLRARRELDSLKYEAALVSNCGIIKLLEGYEEDERFKEAKSNILELERKLGNPEGETKCIKEQSAN